MFRRWQTRSVAGARRCLFVTLLMLLAATLAEAQYRSTQWTADSGLPQNSVRGLVQTPDGFIWVATLNGVAKFDGIAFQVFDKSNTPGISSNRFTAMVAGAAGDLWLASEDNNVVRFHNGKFATLDASSGIRPRSIGAITADGHGGVWVESDARILRWVEASGRFERESFSTDDLHFLSLWWVGTGSWAQKGDKLFCFERGHFHVVPVPAAFASSTIRRAAYGADGGLWIATRDGHLGHLHEGTFTVKSDTFVTPMLSPAEPNWNVLVPQNLARTLSFPSGGMDHAIQYNVILQDDERNLWIGSEGQGLFRIQKQSVQTFSAAQGLSSDNVYPILHSGSGDMWVGSWPAALTRIHDGKVIAAYTKKDGLPALVTSLTEDRKGTLWVGTHGGVRTLSNGHLVTPKLTLPVSLASVQVIHERDDGAMLFGTPHGLYIADGPRSRWLTTKDGLASDDVRVIITDHHGDLWIAGYGGLTRVHDGQFTRWTEKEGIPSNNIRSILEDSSQEIWVGTYDGGIGWLRNGRWVTFDQRRGLFDNGAFQILEDQHGHFWISSNRGLYRVSRGQLEAVADGREPRVNSIAYGRADGMLNIECNGGLWPAGAKDSRGFLWFPTQKGVAIVDPANVRVIHEPPRVSIEEATIEHNAQPALEHVILHPGQTNLEIHYTALSYAKPEQISFRYQLDGIDKGWQEVGYRRTAFYSHLPPGTYVFRVAAQNSDSVPSARDATLLVTVVPPFYRRWWFVAIVCLLAFLLLWSVLHYRVKQLKLAQAAQQAFSRQLIASQEGERRRIAAELHDSLGQRLIIINNLALFLLRTKGRVRTEEEKQQTMEEINAEASAAIEETRAISYALRPFQLDRLGLTRAIQALAKTVTRASEIQVETDLADVDDVFPEELRINFYRIVQESLNNVVKHSGASRATVVVRRDRQMVTLTVADDGQGLPSEANAAQPGQGGFGLTGMRERANLLYGSLQIRNGPSAGTLLTIEFPVKAKELV